MDLVFNSGSQSEFALAQFHVHAPSEHTYRGYQYDLEMHFVHTYLDGSLGAVIGVFFDRERGGDGDNLFIDQLNAIWTGAGTVRTNQDVHVEGFLDSLNLEEFWSYSGSLTTPPCTEGIKWSVLKSIQPISVSQLAKFTALWADDNAYAGGNGNNRETQSLNGRTVYKSNWTDPALKIATIVLGVLFGLALVALTVVVCILKIKPEKFNLVKKAKVGPPSKDPETTAMNAPVTDKK
jgi:carbonic anhydrase